MLDLQIIRDGRHLLWLLLFNAGRLEKVAGGTNMAKKSESTSRFHPTHISAWIVVFILRVLSLLSMNQKQICGAKLGLWAHRKLKKRTIVAQKNVSACFPNLSPEDHNKIVQDSYIACARGLMESTHSWWRDISPYVNNMIVTGKENLEKAQSRGSGVLLIGGHFSIFDFALPLFASQLSKPGYMYRPHDNPVVDHMIEQGRRRHYGIQGFHKRQLKDMIEFIKSRGEVWYAVDQDFRDKCDVFAPFFGVTAACVSAPSWIAKESGAAVLVVSQFRHPNGQYEIAFSPILEGFGEDQQADAVQWNQLLAEAISQHPAQYLWLHKRFKTRKPGDGEFY